MKKLCALFILTASAAMLNAEYGPYGNTGGCSGQGYQQNQYVEGQYQQYPQSQYKYERYGYEQYGQYPQGQQYQHGQYPQSQYGQYKQGQNSQKQFSQQREYSQQGQSDQYQKQNGNTQNGKNLNMQNQRNNQSESSQYTQQGYGYSQNEGNMAQTDQQLTTKIKDSLRSSFSDKYNNVNVSVSNGTATLTGTVSTEEDKQDLEQKVRGISGVQNVNNQVKVQKQGHDASQH